MLKKFRTNLASFILLKIALAMIISFQDQYLIPRPHHDGLVQYEHFADLELEAVDMTITETTDQFYFNLIVYFKHIGDTKRAKQLEEEWAQLKSYRIVLQKQNALILKRLK